MLLAGTGRSVSRAPRLSRSRVEKGEQVVQHDELECVFLLFFGFVGIRLCLEGPVLDEVADVSQLQSPITNSLRLADREISERMRGGHIPDDRHGW